jgi:heptosyltransferase-2
MDRQQWDRILVLQTSFLGDTVLALPLLAEIKRRLPSAYIGVLCTPLGQEILRHCPSVDEIIIDDKTGLHRGWRGLWRIAAALRQKAFMVALTPHKSLRSALLLALARIPVRVGFRQSKGSFLFHRRVHRDPTRHDVERNLSLLEVLGIQPEDCDRVLRLPVAASAEESVRQHLLSLGAHPEKMIVGINAGSVWPTKRWAAQGFAEVISRLKAKYDCEVWLLGGPDDAQVEAEIQELCNGSALGLAGKLPLGELPAALGFCRVLVTNDSGPMHIAVARDVPTVAIFCATTPELGFYPYSDRSIVVEKKLHCRPCGSHGGLRCPLGTEDCIRLIRPEQVLMAVERLLASPKEGLKQTRNSYQPARVTI